LIFLAIWIVLAAYREPGMKATVPIYKVLVRPDQESISKPASIETGALTTGPLAGQKSQLPSVE